MMDSKEAETRAREFIKQKHSKVERILFKTMYREKICGYCRGKYVLNVPSSLVLTDRLSLG